MWRSAPNIIHPAVVKVAYDKIYGKNPAYKSINTSSIQRVKTNDEKK